MNLLVTGAFAWTRDELNIVNRFGHNVVFMGRERDELPCKADWVEGIIGNGIFLSHPIEKFTNLRYIQLTSAGFDRAPMEYIKAHKIEIFNARGVYSVPMAEFAVCGVLQIYKQSKFFYENQSKHQWIKNRGLSELYGKNVCIVGCGSVGTECAKRFGAFGCNITGVDAVPYTSPHYSQMLPLEALNAALNIGDIVVLTVPLNEKTVHLLDEEKFEKFKKGSVFINIARGAVTDTDALIKALENRLLGAVLDVFEEEPLGGDSRLWDMENVIITPHNSFVGDGNHKRMFDLILHNLGVTV